MLSAPITLRRRHAPALAGRRWRRIAGGTLDLQMIAALITGLLAIGGAAMLLSLKASPSPPAEEPFLVPAAMLALCLAGAIISVLGASIVTGQLLGSLAALAGGWCLVQYIAVLRGGSATAWSKGTELILTFAAATVLIQVALLAPKANPVASNRSASACRGRAGPGPLRGLVPGARPLRPLVAGLLIAIPAILAILTAILFAPHGAALGFS